MGIVHDVPTILVDWDKRDAAVSFDPGRTFLATVVCGDILVERLVMSDETRELMIEVAKSKNMSFHLWKLVGRFPGHACGGRKRMGSSRRDSFSIL